MNERNLRLDRRALLSGLVFAAGFGSIGTAGASGVSTGSPRDFDYFIGSWKVHHRRLRKRLIGSTDWEEFEGATRCESLFGGAANLNESVSFRGGVKSHGLGLRAFDPKSGRWADWYLSGGDPTHIDPPGVGTFANGVGTFLSDEVYEGAPVKVRGLFRSLDLKTAQWEQAFSTDGGVTWETNWVMRYSRVTSVVL
jgi:hypothetical protein